MTHEEDDKAELPRTITVLVSAVKTPSGKNRVLIEFGSSVYSSILLMASEARDLAESLEMKADVVDLADETTNEKRDT